VTRVHAPLSFEPARASGDGKVRDAGAERGAQANNPPDVELEAVVGSPRLAAGRESAAL
jgi:hypothetical protein